MKHQKKGIFGTTEEQRETVEAMTPQEMEAFIRKNGTPQQIRELEMISK